MQGLSETAFEIAASKNLLDSKCIYYSHMVDLCLHFKWTPAEYKAQSPKDISIFSAVLAGKKKYKKLGFM